MTQRDNADAGATNPGGGLLGWVRHHRLLAAVGALVVVVGITTVVVLKVTQKPHSILLNYPGTVEEPASWRHEMMWEDNERGRPWRSTFLSSLLEIPLADGYTTGRCFVTEGIVGFARWDEAEAAAAPLSIAFASGGVIVATEDPDLPCNAGAIARKLERVGGDELTLAEAQLHPGGSRDWRFMEFSYVPGDAELDAIVVATRAAEAGEPIPPESAIFALDYVYSEVNLDEAPAP